MATNQGRCLAPANGFGHALPAPIPQCVPMEGCSEPRCPPDCVPTRPTESGCKKEGKLQGRQTPESDLCQSPWAPHPRQPAASIPPDQRSSVSVHWMPQPRQGQQLVHQMDGAIAALQRVVERLASQHIIGFSQCHLCLGTNGSDGCAQLVRRICRESALGFQQLADALEQAIESIDHGCDLCRSPIDCQRLQRIGLAGRQGLAQLPHGGQTGVSPATVPRQAAAMRSSSAEVCRAKRQRVCCRAMTILRQRRPEHRPLLQWLRTPAMNCLRFVRFQIPF